MNGTCRCGTHARFPIDSRPGMFGTYAFPALVGRAAPAALRYGTISVLATVLATGSRVRYHGAPGRAERGAERAPTNPLYQSLPRHARHLRTASLSQRVSAGVAVGRCRFGRGAAPIQRSARSRLRV